MKNVNMKNDKIKNIIFVAEFLLVIVLLGVPSCIRIASQYISPDRINNENVAEGELNVEGYMSYFFFGKRTFLNLNGAVSRLMEQPMLNDVIKLDNGYLLMPMPYASDETLKGYAEATAAFNEYLKGRGTQLVYVAPPYTSCKYDPQLPAGAEDHGNDNTDRFLTDLRSKGVDVIDIRERMHDEGMDHYEMMYRTDHHWTTEAGLYVYGILEEYIKEKTGCSVDEKVADIKNYNVKNYPKRHLGSNGQRTGACYAGIDDFDLITPAFETDISDEDGNRGSIEEIILNTKALEGRYDWGHTYDDVLKKSFGSFINHKCDNDVKILIISDSYSQTVIPFLTAGFSQLHFVYENDTSTLSRDMIEDYDPDIVVMMYYANHLTEGSVSFEFKGF